MTDQLIINDDLSILDTGLLGSGTITLSGTIDVDYTANTVTGSLSTGLLGVLGAQTYSSFGLTYDSATNTYTLTSSGTLTNLTLTYTGQLPTSDSATVHLLSTGVALIGGSGSVTSSSIACFVAGTSIRTARGEIPVEQLEVGSLIITLSGEEKPIKWIGHRRLRCDAYPNPQLLWPVRITKDAFGDGRPVRDLWLSPGHSIKCGSVLIPVSALQNGQTIAQIPRSTIEYWHVELDQHDLILAEGLAVESYLDTGNRTSFVNGGAFLSLHPELEPHPCSDTCLPLVLEGDEVVRAKTVLLEQVKVLSYHTTSESHLHILADGRRVEPVQLGAWRYLFIPPEGCARIVLCSRSFIPAHISAASFDRRTLGICVARLQIDGEEVPLDRSASFGTGWDELERDGSRRMWRWTNGQASLPAKTRAVLIDLAGPGHYWEEPEPRAMAKIA